MMEKRIRKIVEAVIVKNEERLTDTFGKVDYSDILKHKNQVSLLVLSDNKFLNIIENEIEDCIEMYLLRKKMKNRKKERN